MRMTAIYVLLALLLCMTTAGAVTVDNDTTLSTFDGVFNYSFPATGLEFDLIAVHTDAIVQLNNTNVSIYPIAGTGNATIYLMEDESKNFTVCSNDTNVNMSFQNLTAYYNDVYIVEDTTWIREVAADQNITFNATTDCKTVMVNNTAPIVTLTDPSNTTTQETNTNIYLTVTETVANITYSLDSGANVTLCADCSSISASNNFTVNENPHNITVYVTGYLGLMDSQTVYWTVEKTSGGGSSYTPPITIPPVIENITEDIVEEIEEIIEVIETQWDVIAGYMNQTIYEDNDVCFAKEYYNVTSVLIGTDPVTGKPIYELTGDEICTRPLVVKMSYPVILLGAIAFVYILYFLGHTLESYRRSRRYGTAQNQRKAQRF